MTWLVCEYRVVDVDVDVGGEIVGYGLMGNEGSISGERW